MGLGRVTAALLFDRNFVEDSLDIQAERMELKDYAEDSSKVEDIHCSLEALDPLVDHYQIPCGLEDPSEELQNHHDFDCARHDRVRALHR